MTLTLYNTLTRRKEPFQPIDPANVRMYVCGPTVYDFAHIGNARPIIVFDVLFRLLRHVYGADHVTYARNITDVDDKINARAVERYPDLPPTEAIAKLTHETTKQFHKDIAALGVLPPTVEPRATDHIKEMRELCEALVAKSHAYVAEEHVLFSVASMADYGKLANRSLDEMEAGARVDVAPYKRGSMDFVLWKPSKPGEPAWPSPCGIATDGRPGWHIECSAMSDRWLWQEPQLKGLLSEAGLKQPHVFDIHGGGIDLAFPHHENEIAQSRCGHGTHAMANYWMHNGFLQVEGEKMSKSLGNFITINDVLREWLGPVARHAMLLTHYRQPIDWTRDKLVEARLELRRWALAVDPDQVGPGAFERAMEGTVDPYPEVIKALSDDLNSPGAIAFLRERFAAEQGWTADERARFAATLAFFGTLTPRMMRPLQGGVTAVGLSRSIAREALSIGLELQLFVANGVTQGISNATNQLKGLGVVSEFDDLGELTLRVPDIAGDDPTIEQLIASRLDARKRKDFKESDRIRDELAAMGIALKDSKNPQTGEIETAWEVRASGTTEVKR